MYKLIAAGLAISVILTGCATQPPVTVVQQPHEEERPSAFCEGGNVSLLLSQVDGFRLSCEAASPPCYVYGPNTPLTSEEYERILARFYYAAKDTCFLHQATCPPEGLAGVRPGEHCFGYFFTVSP